MDGSDHLAGSIFMEIDNHAIVDRIPSHSAFKSSHYSFFLGVDLDKLASKGQCDLMEIRVVIEDVYVVFEDAKFCDGDLH